MTTFTLGIDEEEGAVAVAVDAAREDGYWRDAHARARYSTPTHDYEDYAPAYCVGVEYRARACASRQ